MSIFSRTVVVTGTTGTYLLEDEDEQGPKFDPLKQAVLRAILNDEELVPAMMGAYTRSIGEKSHDFYNYGAEGDYYFGLPEGTVEKPAYDDATVQAVIESEVGEPITMTSVLLGPPDGSRLATEYIQNYHGYDIETGWINDWERLYNPGNSNVGVQSYYISGRMGLDGSCRITYKKWNMGKKYWQGGHGFSTDIRTGKEYYNYFDNIPPHNYDHYADYYQVTYYLESDPKTLIKFWNYNVNGTKYPELKSLSENAELIYRSPYYPVAPLRVEKADVINEKEDTGNTQLIDGVETIIYGPTKKKKDVTKILDLVDISLKDITKGLHDSPDIAKVDSAFITYAVNIQSKDQLRLKYLYDFFKEQQAYSTYAEVSYSERRYTYLTGAPTITIPADYNYISIIDEEFNTEIKFHYISYKRYSGKAEEGIKVGEYASATQIVSPITVSTGDVLDIVSWQQERSIFKIRKQLSEDEYEEYYIHGLQHLTKGIYRNRITSKTLKDSLDGGDSSNPKERGFFITLSRKILLSYTPEEQDELHTSSLFLVIYAEERKKLKWYETSWFGQIVAAVQVFTLALSFGAPTGWESLVLGIVQSTALTYGVEKLVAEIGGEWAILAAAVGIVVALKTGAGTPNAPWADALLKSSTVAIDVSQEYFKDEALKIMKETAEFLKDAEEQTDEMQEQINLQNEGNSILLDPLDLIRPNSLYFDPNEGVDAFFYRTIGNQNPGVASLDMPDNYVDYMLDLPKANKPEFNN